MVVSSGDLNASGGYMVSYRCSTLVALPNSIIGSIGSFALRPSIKELMDKLGITFDRVTIGPHGTQFSLVNPLTPEEFARFDEVHWEGYDDWVAGVAEHRGMTIEQVDRLARGQVFTGRQALANGLIDELGGLDTAVKRVKQRAGIAADAAVSLVHYPLKRSLWEEISAGDWTAAFHHVLFALGLRSEMQDRLEVTIELWRTWLEEGQTLAVHEWRY
jgi:protease-4